MEFKIHFIISSKRGNTNKVFGNQRNMSKLVKRECFRLKLRLKTRLTNVMNRQACAITHMQLVLPHKLCVGREIV